MRPTIISAALLALLLFGCSGEVKVEENADSTSATTPADTMGTTTAPMPTDTTAPAIGDTAGTSATTGSTTTGTTGSAATPGATTPSTSSTTTSTSSSTTSSSTTPSTSSSGTSSSGKSPSGTSSSATTSGATTPSTQPTTPPPPPPSSGQTGVNGKEVFTASKCNVCHSISGQGISKTLASSKAPDLSSIGSKHDAAWIASFMRQETELNGKKHVKKFSGSDADLQSLSAWLAGLK